MYLCKDTAREGGNTKESFNHTHNGNIDAMPVLLQWICGICQAALFSLGLQVTGDNVQIS